MILTGIDVVDLTEAVVTKKAQNTRFLSRVFTDDEQQIILSSNEPDRTIWLLWSAKEAAYKVVSKIKFPIAFIHKQFRVNLNYLTNIDQTLFQAGLEVIYKNLLINLKSYGNGKKLHTIAIYHNETSRKPLKIHANCRMCNMHEIDDWKKDENLSRFFTDEERASIHHPYAAAVRHDLKIRLTNELNLQPSQLQIIRPSTQNKSQPPYLLINGKLNKIDISLSHHGKWIGWIAVRSG